MPTDKAKLFAAQRTPPELGKLEGRGADLIRWQCILSFFVPWAIFPRFQRPPEGMVQRAGSKKKRTGRT